MADNRTGAPVRSLSDEFLRNKIIDTGGTNEAAVSAAGRISVDGSGVTQPVSIAGTITVDSELPAAAALADATANPTLPSVGSFLVGYNGTTWDRVRTANTGRLQVDVVTGGGANASILVDNAGFTDGTSSVSGIGFIFDEVAGTALTENDIAAGRIDSKRAQVGVIEDATTRGQRLAVSAAGAAASNITQVGGATASATNPLFVELSTGGAAYTLFGQTNATASFSRLTDGTTNVAVIAGTTALKTDISSIAGTATVNGGLAGSQGVGGLAASGAAKSGNPLQIGSVFNTTQPTVTTGQAVESQATARGAQIVATGVDAFTVDTELPAAAALADATANPTVPATGAFLVGYNGSTWDRVRTANTGRLQVDVVTGGGTNASILVDNAGFTDGTSSVTGVGFIFDEVAGTALTENDIAAGRIDSKRAQVGVIEDATTRGQRMSVSAAGAAHSNIAQYLGATASATNPIDVRLSTGAAAYTLFGQTNATAPFSRITDGTTNVAVISGTAALKADLSSVAGTATLTGGVAGSQGIGGLAASGAAKAGNPVQFGAVFTTAQPTVTTGQAVEAQATARGGLIVATGVDAFVVDTELTAPAALADATANPTISNIASHLMGYNGSTWDRVRTANTGRLQVDVITGGGSATLVDNAAFTDGTTPVTPVGFIFDEVAGTALTENDVAASRIDSKRAVIFVGEDATTRGQRWAVSAAGALASNISQIGGATPSATAFVPTRITDGTAYYANTGQTAATGQFIRLTDATNTAAIIASINALKTDFSSVVGAVPSATNPVPVRLTDGAAFYASTSGAPASPQTNQQTFTDLGAGSSQDLDFTAITGGLTGYLMGLDVSATVPLKVEIKTVAAGTPTTRSTLFMLPGERVEWRAPFKTFITQAGGATSRFRATVTNIDQTDASNVYATVYFDQI